MGEARARLVVRAHATIPSPRPPLRPRRRCMHHPPTHHRAACFAHTLLARARAGSSPSRTVTLTKCKDGQTKPPIGLGLQVTSRGVGILVTEIDAGSATADSDLKLGDCILSVDGQVPSSPKDAVHLILKAGNTVDFVVIGDVAATLGA